jgi:signal peptidase I
MFDFGRKSQFSFGGVDPKDDRGIEIVHLRRESRRGLFSEGFKLVRDIVLILAVFLLLGVFVAQPVVVEGTSMLPELHDGERLLVDKLVYYKFKGYSWGHIERGDVVVFWYPKEPEKSYVKRVVGLPGETVEVRNGIIYINGEVMHEPYLDPENNRSLGSFPAKKVDEHYYFVLGDNRDNSSDSRYWGLVPEKYIYGKAFFRYWSPSHIGFLSHGNYELGVDNADDRAAASESGE